MNRRQLEACTERLRDVDEDAADYFWNWMVEADDLAVRSRGLRQMAWATYHEYFEPTVKK